jgi:tetratricopeptide (TPR) repeat protein
MKMKTRLPDQNLTCSNLQGGNFERSGLLKVKCCMSLTLVMMLLWSPVFGNDGIVNGSDNRVLEAYELRISGKADKAAELLSELLKTDSTNAMAHFELARTREHMFLGGTQLTSEAWAEVMDASKQAVRFDPKNEVFAFYYAYTCFFNAFISMMRQQPDVVKNITQSCDAFQAVLNVNPDCYAAMLYLVDIYGILPEEMAGNKEKARTIAADITSKDKIYGAMANARLLPDTANYVVYWQNVEKEVGVNAQVLEELGRAYLLKSDTEKGTEYFMESIKSDVARRYLIMHLARYHIMSSQQDPGNKVQHMEAAVKMVDSYLHSGPELCPPLKAYANGIMALIKMINGDNTGSNEYQEIAKSFDPFYSRATGIPSAMLYTRPDEVKVHYSSFFWPF